MRARTVAVALVVLTLLGAAGATDAAAQDLPRHAGRTNAWSLDLYRHLARADQGNLALSPYSLDQALAMVYAGARGATRRQFERRLRYGPGLHGNEAAVNRELAARRNPGVALEAANAVWPQESYPLRRRFRDVLARFYADGLRPLDFRRSDEAIAAINRWVSERTMGRIPTLFDRLADDTRLVLTNAIWMKAQWKDRFDPSLTRDGAFYRRDGSVVQVPFMHREVTAPILFGDRFQAIDLPYVGEALSMLVVVPADVEAFERRLNGRVLREIVARLRPSETMIHLPRFELRSRLELIRPLQRLGLTLPFDDRRVDLSGIANVERLVVDDVVQESWVRVDEEGTEAAAATGVGIGPTSGPPTIMANRPFLFFIRDRPTGLVLFAGRVADPSVSS